MVATPFLTNRFNLRFHFRGRQRRQIQGGQSIGRIEQAISLPATNFLAEQMFDGLRFQ